MSSSKRYPEEFKIEAVKQVTNKGHSVAEVVAHHLKRYLMENEFGLRRI